MFQLAEYSPRDLNAASRKEDSTTEEKMAAARERMDAADRGRERRPSSDGGGRVGRGSGGARESGGRATRFSLWWRTEMRSSKGW
jgi:hypothetical protein